MSCLVSRGLERVWQTVQIHAKMVSSKNGGGYLFPNTFQLFSLGPDGVQDDDDAEEEDDIVYMKQ